MAQEDENEPRDFVIEGLGEDDFLDSPFGAVNPALT
jgi:hypothetical protein